MHRAKCQVHFTQNPLIWKAGPMPKSHKLFSNNNNNNNNNNNKKKKKREKKKKKKNTKQKTKNHPVRFEQLPGTQKKHPVQRSLFN